jgi:hypothetical protein
MLNPGRVGLTVVDSFAMGVPMVTTDWRGHAPEFDYLEPGGNGIVTGDNLIEFAATAERLLTHPKQLGVLREGCLASSEKYQVEAMAGRFVAGVEQALDAGRRRGSNGHSGGAHRTGVAS